MKKLDHADLKEKIIFWITSFVILIYFAGVGYFSVYTMPNTMVNGINYSFKPKTNLMDRNKDNFSIKIIGRNQKEYQIFKDSIHFEVEVPKDIRLEQNTFLWPISFFTNRQYNIHYNTSYDEKALRFYLENSILFKDVVKPQDAKIVKNGNRYIIQEEVEGDELNTDRLIRSIEQAFIEQRNQITLDAEYETPELRQTSLRMQRLVREMNRLQDVIITIDLGYRKYILEGEELVRYLNIKDGLLVGNIKKIREYISTIAQETDAYTDTINFKPTNGDMMAIHNYNYGWQMNITATSEKLKDTLEQVRSDTIQPIYAREGIQRERNTIGGRYLEIDLRNQMIYYYNDYVIQSIAYIKNSEGIKTSGIYRILNKENIENEDMSLSELKFQKEITLVSSSELNKSIRRKAYILSDKITFQPIYEKLELNIPVIIITANPLENNQEELN